MQIIKLKSKKGQESMGLSFGMIFSIILIVFFFAAAFFGIKAFLGWQKQIQIGSFLEELQNRVDEAWHSSSSKDVFNSTLPSGVKYICFVNISSPSINANTIEKDIYTIMNQGYLDPTKNLYVYSPDKDYGITWKKIDNLALPSRNPRCIPVVNGRVSIKIERNFEDAFPRITS